VSPPGVSWRGHFLGFLAGVIAALEMYHEKQGVDALRISSVFEPSLFLQLEFGTPAMMAPLHYI